MKTTDLLYYSDRYMKDFSAEVLSVSPKGDRWDVVLDKTCFYPEGGGQPGDRGFIGEAEVVDVVKRNGIVHHVTASNLGAGENVSCSIDWERRFDYMQQHTGQHIVSGVLYNFGYGTVSVHQGERYTTIETDAAQIGKEDLERIEEEVNSVIAANVKIRDYQVADSEIPELNLRRAPKVSGQIRIVEIEGYDRVACGGVHTASTGEVLFAKIIFTEKIRSHIRIAWLLGNRVLPDYRRKTEIAGRLSELFSAKEDAVVSAAEKVMEENRELKKELGALRMESARREVENLLSSAEKPGGVAVAVKRFENMDSGYLKQLVSSLPDEGVYALCFVNVQGERVQWVLAVTAEGFDFNKYRGDLLAPIQGKGGGRAPVYQGIGENPEGVEDFFTFFRRIFQSE